MDDQFPKEKLPVLSMGMCSVMYIWRQNTRGYWIRKHLTILTKKEWITQTCFRIYIIQEKKYNPDNIVLFLFYYFFFSLLLVLNEQHLKLSNNKDKRIFFYNNKNTLILIFSYKNQTHIYWFLKDSIVYKIYHKYLIHILPIDRQQVNSRLLYKQFNLQKKIKKIM